MNPSASSHPDLRFAKLPSVQHERRRTARTAKRAETANMRLVRDRDQTSRWPGGRVHGATEVAHLTHRGMGGNPIGDRSAPHRMILLEREIHEAFDAGELRIQPTTRKGTAGPCDYFQKLDTGAWALVGRESAPHVWVLLREEGHARHAVHASGANG